MLGVDVWGALLDTDILLALEADDLFALETPLRQMMADFAADFEKTVYRAALDFTHGRKVEAAVKLGVGRNTITRKIQELGLE